MSRQSTSHKAFLNVLQEKESSGKYVTTQDIINATGWKRVTFETYLRKGQLSEYLTKIEKDKFSVTNTIGIDSNVFSRNLSQSKHRRELGFNCNSYLAKALLKKSWENMILALELYNRPSLDNRLDSFVLCFCTAWEQLLKSILIERDGEDSIFRDNSRDSKIRQTISLRECLSKFYKKESPVRKNIERIVYYRDQAVHLLMPEVQGLMSRIFQSGIMNYEKEFYGFSEQSFLPTSHSGMLSLVAELGSPSNATILSKYGEKLGNELISTIESLEREANEVDNIEFAIPLNVKLVFAASDDKGNMIALSKAEAGMEGLAEAIVVEKPVDREKTHPHRTTDAVKEINKRLNERYNRNAIKTMLKISSSKSNKYTINEFDFRSVVYKLKWKNSNNAEHYLHKNPDTHYFSDSAIEIFIDKVMNNDEYLDNARKSYSRRKKQNGK